jgi:long-chain acyl-CoA synthetase
LRFYDDDRIVHWEDFLAEGKRLVAEDPQAFDRLLHELDPDAPAMVVYTSGTTGNPKGALLTSRNVIAPGLATVDILGFTENDTVLSYLPLCHVAEKIFSLFLPLSVGAVVHFGEAIETVQEDLRQVSPTVFLGVPRIWEKMHAGVQIKMQDSSWIKRKIFKAFSGEGNRADSWGTSCCTGRCRSASDYGIAASPFPARPPSRPISCSGIAASASIFSKGTDRPRAPA